MKAAAAQLSVVHEPFCPSPCYPALRKVVMQPNRPWTEEAIAAAAILNDAGRLRESDWSALLDLIDRGLAPAYPKLPPESAVVRASPRR
jgi:hypothetical protein